MRITNEHELQEFLKKTGWQSFEKLVASIFEENGYKTTVNTVMEGTQIDVTAERCGKRIVIECKKWNTNNSTKLRAEAAKQVKRMKLLNAQEGMIVTLKESPEKEMGQIRVVPLNKLNNYLNLE